MIKKKERGITLIALVVTIIVLIILAVISINVVFGDEGILARALEGQEKQKMAEAREEVQLMLTDYVVEREVNNKQLMDYLLEQKEKGNLEEVTDNEDGTITVEVDGYEIIINKGNLEILDVAKNGKSVKINLSKTTAEVDEEIKATITFGDEIKYKECKYVITQSKDAITNESTYTNSITSNPQEIDLTTSTEGTYYLHILVVDTEGNKLEKISNEIKIVREVAVESVTVSPEAGTLLVGEKLDLTATIAPSDATNQNVTWSSGNTNIATVDQNGKVTAVALGEATIKVTTEDGNKTATCTITVSKPVQAGATTHTPTSLTYTWEEISKIAKEISNTNLQESVAEDGEITNDTAEVNLNIDGKAYTIGVGDTKTLTIGTTNYVVRVMGFNHDKLTSTSAYGQEGIINVYAGISFEFVDFLTNAAMNGTSSSSSKNAGGWAASAMHGVVSGYQDDVETAMGGTYLKQVEKKYLATYNSGTQSTSSDYLWLLACSEIWSKGARYSGGDRVRTDGAYGYAYASEGDQYKYYKIKETGDSSYSTANNDFKKPSSVTGKTSSGQDWWLRSPDDKYANSFCEVSATGACIDKTSYYKDGVAPGFSI